MINSPLKLFEADGLESAIHEDLSFPDVYSSLFV